MRPSVADFYSVTPYHYIYAGPAGFDHFHFLLNVLISDISHTTISEVNRAYACVLFKGHNKDKFSAQSYRTISTCPVIAKGLDTYLRLKNLDSWNVDQSPAQFQGEGSSHELAGVLLTECVQFSRFRLKKPLYVLYLDAKSAFDVVQKELLVRNLFSIHGPDKMILHVDNRLSFRETILDWNGNLMGPIYDQQGLEQGGKNSSDFYKIFGKEQLSLAQNSELGVKMGNITISAIGQADDTLLLSNDIFALFYLLALTMIFCQKYLVQLSAEKTRLQVFSAVRTRTETDFPLTNPININGLQIPFSDQAEHVGILRSPHGNLPAIMNRITAHKKALASILHVGAARSHRANPMMSIRVEKLYATPVLLSGIGSLVLLKKEMVVIEKYYCQSLCSLQRLPKNTPRCVTYFLGGSLPGEALLHMRQLDLFGMICRLRSENCNLLQKHAENFFSAAVSFRGSWFTQIRNYCLLYGLPHPSSLIDHPPEKEVFKRIVKKKVISYWEEILRQEASALTSLKHFKPQFMSLVSPHPLWQTAEHFPHKVAMATIQSHMISGRYRCGALTRPGVYILT